MTNLFIVDDHQLIIDGLVDMLGPVPEIEIVGTASDGQEAVEKILITQPDLVLLDLDLPKKNGFEVLKEVRAKCEGVKFIILSMHLEKALLEKALRMNVQGYLPKTVNKDELMLAIEKVSQGRQHYSTEVTLNLASSGKSRHEIDPFLINELSPREKDVLKELASGKTNKDISDVLHISHFTVETHRKNLMRKLDAHTVADLIRIAFKSGLIE